MHRFLPAGIAVVLFAFSGCAASGQSVVEPAPAVERPVPYAVTPPPAFRHAIENGTRTTTGQPGPNYFTQDATYDLHARIDPDTKRLDGSGRIVYVNNSPDVLDELHLELIQNLHREGAVRVEFTEVTGGIDLARVAVAGVELSIRDEADETPGYTVTGTNLALYPPQPVDPGSSVTIDLEWSFVVPKEGASGRMGHDGDNLFFVGYWYPIMAVYDDVEGWYTEQFMGQTEFYAGFADYDVTVEMPANWIVSATGELQNPEAVLAPFVLQRMRQAYESDEPVVVVGLGDVDRATRDGMLSWHFTAERVRDFAFSATRESIWEAARASVGDPDDETRFTLINTFYRQTAPFWERVTAYQQHSITFHSHHTGFPYPWPHMTAVEGGGIIGGGMEFPMMTIMGDYNERGPAELYFVTAHELAHMWVPMIVSNNERRFSWMDEGITTFNESEARLDYFPDFDHHVHDQQIYLYLAQMEGEGAIIRHSAFHSSPFAFGIASYLKPSTVLVALREVLGEDLFYEGYHAFIDEWAYRHPYPWDLFHTFERVAGENLDWFWHTWFYETWTLDQAIADVRSNGRTTTIVVRDEGLAPMPVLLEIELADGRVIQERVPVDVWLSGARTTEFTLTTTSPVSSVVIDPEMRFPDVDRSNNVWTRR